MESDFDFREKIAEVSEKLKEMQEDQGDWEGEDLEMEEQDEPNDIGQEIVHLTEPQMRKNHHSIPKFRSEDHQRKQRYSNNDGTKRSRAIFIIKAIQC